MNNNHITQIGADHKVCQDYTASGCVNNVECGPTFYAIACDGCSSGPHTEFGAQLITHAAIKELQINPYKVPENFMLEIMWRAKDAVKHVGIDERCLLSTLLLVRADDKDTIVWAFGDGVFHVKYKGGQSRLTQIEYSSNAPFYGYYNATQKERDAYIAAFDLCKKVFHTHTDGSVGEETYTGAQAMLPTSLWLHTPNIESVTLMTDGVESFQDVNKHSIDFKQIVSEVTSFKTATGQYVERRLRAFTQRVCVANGWSHYDDLGVAGISL